MACVIELVRYNLPCPPSRLYHTPMNFWERVASLLMNSHVCQICGRKEIWSVSGWLQIDDPVHRDKNGCSVVCIECARANPDVFCL